VQIVFYCCIVLGFVSISCRRRPRRTSWRRTKYRNSLMTPSTRGTYCGSVCTVVCTRVNQLTPTVASWVQIQIIMCQTGLSRRL